MASHGAAKEMAVNEAPARSKPPKVFDGMELKAGETGGVVAEHRFTHYEHKPEVHIFGEGDGHKLSAHIEKHLGIKMPGKSSIDKAESREGDENEE